MWPEWPLLGMRSVDILILQAARSEWLIFAPVMR
jgi:hypothetical protein